MNAPRLSLGPLLYYWPRERVAAFYEQAEHAAVDVVYLGEVVCGKRHELKLADWMAIGRRLAARGKEVVLSSLALPESESDLRALRRLVGNGEFAIEVNDMGAVKLAAQARVPFVVGLHVNAYHPAALAYLQRCGALRWVAPVELPGESWADASLQLPDLQTELFAYGRLPLAFSARCFTARAYGLAKDECAFRCLDDPDGLATTTVEHVPVLVLNGVQTQSARPYSLASKLDEVRDRGIDLLRISPQAHHTWEIVRAFRDCLDGRLNVPGAAEVIDKLSGTVASSGFWHGKPGMHVRAAARA